MSILQSAVQDGHLFILGAVDWLCPWAFQGTTFFLCVDWSGMVAESLPSSVTRFKSYKQELPNTLHPRMSFVETAL